MSDRIDRLRTALERAETALKLSDEPIWHEIFESVEQEMLGRLLALGPDDDEARWRLSQAIGVARQVRTLIEQRGSTRDGLLKQLDLLEGRAMPAIA
jgi:hypothetical protein